MFQNCEFIFPYKAEENSSSLPHYQIGRCLKWRLRHHFLEKRYWQYRILCHTGQLSIPHRAATIGTIIHLCSYVMSLFTPQPISGIPDHFMASLTFADMICHLTSCRAADLACINKYTVVTGEALHGSPLTSYIFSKHASVNNCNCLTGSAINLINSLI